MIAEWLFFALTAALLAGDYPYREAVPGYRYQFPQDYFEHPEFRTEWWYYTGNVRTAAGGRYGFELVFFRRAEHRGPSDNASAWRVDDLYLAHLALTDINGRRFVYRERLNRAGPGIAGASFAGRRVWNGNWSARWDGERQTLEAVVIHGQNGVSRKAEGAGKASYYISFPRLAVAGEINGRKVEGTAWMDHEWFTHQLESTQQGWDWFSAQLDDGTELMLFQLRRRDGGIDPYSSGSYVDRQGRARHLVRGEFTLQPVEFWTSPKTKARYPVKWRISIPALHISMECSAAVANQELLAEHGGPTYWEGAVSYSGSATGVGYLEMTGYAGPVGL